MLCTKMQVQCKLVEKQVDCLTQNGKRQAAVAHKTPQPQKKAKVEVPQAPKSAPAKVQGKGAALLPYQTGGTGWKH